VCPINLQLIFFLYLRTGGVAFGETLVDGWAHAAEVLGCGQSTVLVGPTSHCSVADGRAEVVEISIGAKGVHDLVDKH